MTRRAYSRIGYRVIRGQGELVGHQKDYGKCVVLGVFFDHCSESVNSNRMRVFLCTGSINLPSDGLSLVPIL